MSPWLLGRAAVHAFSASLRVTALMRRCSLDKAICRLRAGQPIPRALCDPALLSRVVNRLLPSLPPWGMGACMKRSLLLLHLWSRCGLTPRLHLGYIAERDGRRQGHAWVTVDEPRLAVAAPSERCVEAYVFESA